MGLIGCFDPVYPSGVPCDNGLCPGDQVCTADLRCAKPDEEGTDAGSDTPDVDWAFERIAISNGSDDQDPTLTGDLLEVIWSSSRGGNYDLWHATRTNVTAAWSEPVALAILNSVDEEQSPELSRNGLELYYSSSRDAGRDIFFSRRANRASPFDPPTKVVELDIGDEPNIGVSGDFAVVDCDLGTGRDLFYTTRTSGTWSPPTRIAELATALNDGSPFLTDDRLQIYFHRMEPYQMYVASRPTPDAAFDEAVPLFDLGDSDPWASPDQQTLAFSRDGDLYFAMR